NRDGNVLEKGKTDSDGKYSYLKKMPGKVYLVTAKKGNQTGILPMKIPALDMSEFDLGKRKYRNREIFVYSPRDMYRPGETISVSALLRDDDGNPVDPMPLKAKLFRPDRKQVKSFTWQVQKLGSGDLNYYQTNIDLPNDAQTGKWNLKLWDEPSAKSPGSIYTFHVEEFLPERMKLDLKADPEFPGPEDNLEISVSGQYLYGAPASGNEVGGKVRVKAIRSLFDSLKGFEFGDIKDKTYRDLWEFSEEKLDKLGNITLDIPNRWQEINSPLSVRVAVDLFESGGRPVTRAVDKTIWPAKSLIGIRPQFAPGSSVDAGPVNFEVVKVKTDGTLEADEGLMVELIKEDRDYYWEFSESTGWIYKHTQKNYQYLTQNIDLKQGRATPLTLHLQNGQYVLAVKDPETNLTTSIRFRVGYWWYGNDQAGSARPDKVVMTLDQPAYRPGDVISLTITPPHSGEAVVTVEGEHPLWVKRMPVSSEGSVVEIPMLAGWDTHNIYISSTVFRPGDAKEKITPNRAAGLIHLPLDRGSRKLNIDIDAPQKARPQAPMTVRLTADRLENQETFVTLAAVDVGILNITDFKTPDPLKYFFEKRRYDVNSYDIYSKVIELMDGNPAALRYGGDADLAGGKRPENKVRLLSLFQAPVAFDESGEAWVTFNLPDFNGKLRLMALAFDTNNFGWAEKEVTVAAPVVTQLAMPRFMAPGDKSEFTLDIHNLSGEAKDISMTLKTDGPIELEKGEQTLQLADQEKTTIRFPVTARADYGTAGITLKLSGEDISLNRNWTLPVRPGYPATTRKVFKSLAQNETLTLDPALAADMIEATVDAELKISTEIPLSFQNAMKGLITYPYGCLEQTSSRAYPLLYATPEQIARYNLPIITAQERISRLEKAITRISSMQLASGGFGLWNKNSPETSWLSAYATDFLLTARDMGVDVPNTMLDKALKRMEFYLKKGPPTNTYMDNNARDHVNFAVKSYAAYILSRLNRASLGTLRTLFDNHHKKSSSCLPLAYIGIALKRMGDAKRSQEALELAAAKRIEKYGYWGDYSSLVRDLALTANSFLCCYYEQVVPGNLFRGGIEQGI
ncbi:MG2 domain-containing protein, partial [Desulfobacterales bacterium HSG17]|nr:MG2 domain-containing protein [Desulfobacterales bacterium HSG17]